MPDCVSAAAPAAVLSPREDGWAAASQGMRSLRGVTILLLLELHSTLPYMSFLKPPTTDFVHPPYAWLAFPIIDSQRWLGFDIFAAWLDVFLMSLMFFLSGLFAWPSLDGKGGGGYLLARLTRLGAPFVLALFVIMPIALYPAYLATGLDPRLTAYAQAYLSLPFWPNGPMWFLWLLLAMTVIPAALHRFIPGLAARLAQTSASAAGAPGRYFLGLVAAATLAYVPLALAFTPWDWSNHGVLSFQMSRPLLYFVYYLAGCGVGAQGLAEGLLAGRGRLAQHWGRWALAALASLFLWMGLTGLSLSYPDGAPLILQAVSDISYAVASACSVLFALAAAIRWRARRSRSLDALARHAFGIYLLHYAPLVWLQYGMLSLSASPIVKAALVFAGTLGASYAGSSAYAWALRGARAPARAAANG